MIFIEMLDGKNWLMRYQPKTILCPAFSFYDFLKVTDYGAAVATYGDRPVSIEALGKILKGEIQPNGQLPVELPGRYQLGWGLKEF